MDRLILADASRVSGADFLRMVSGRPALTPTQRAQHDLDRQAWLRERKAQSRRDLEKLRDNLCELASPELAATWRKKWAAEDAEQFERERRAA